ncbi:hypothetical protein IJ21_25910 [Paenibacillus sp. 32O-W]|uniref:hypothetical protein n=1 Tax=Paenibacillus sp. 32O-W TaxID=1695218 RepID=UPI000720C742|nr:hypothetical protein [Paenibacillus sp. 32O-W]ALS27987.1 hypothetical protein IJ21_25910 [Paenibacillus sp. 32O-W]
MIRYGQDTAEELRFTAFYPRIERRNEHWVDIELRFELSPQTPAPADAADLTALVICTPDGEIFQIVPQEEGCDSEFQFTVAEKEQIAAFIARPDIQAAIAEQVAAAQRER